VHQVPLVRNIFRHVTITYMQYVRCLVGRHTLLTLLLRLPQAPFYAVPFRVCAGGQLQSEWGIDQPYGEGGPSSPLTLLRYST